MPNYVNKPGGVIVHLKDGTSANLAYGDKVPEDNIADHVDIKTFSDGKARKPEVDPAVEANRRAALAENGQVNSSSSPVPGNYSELDEDAAAQLVTNLAAYPEQQATVLQHEIAFGGNRQKVVDAASDYAKEAAGLRNDARGEFVEGNQGEDLIEKDPVVPLSDPYSRTTGTGDSGLSKDEEKAQLAALTAEEPPEQPAAATPPPSGS